jgi:hypothetical protein
MLNLRELERYFTHDFFTDEIIMLAEKLYQFYDIPKLKKERSILKNCRGLGDGIWDILGFYVPSTSEIVICDSEIENYAKKLAQSSPEYDNDFTKYALRELVRLHEHGHALLHTGNIGPLRRFKKGYKSLPSVVNEPITEFIAWSTLKSFGTKFFEKIFEKVDENTPDYYQKWKDIKQMIDCQVKNIDYIDYIPGLVYVARKELWKDFESFCKGLEQEWNVIKTITIARRIGRKEK